ncbi:MAG: 4-(cytidine 5'-diphospho)-2-C-methyl-D-erythritol kinase [Myxococcota bacterium]
MSRQLRLRGPAKLNLGLAIVGRRADGYHLLDSVFAPIDLCDEIEIEVEPGGEGVRLECLPPLDPELPALLHQIPAGPDNLVHRAARLFCERAGYRAGVTLRLAKAIPAGAGLGGGSSDAAIVLRGLAELSGLEPGAKALARWALELGADVPFFLDPKPSRVRGIGEQIEPLDGVPELDVLLVNPGKTLATADVYRRADQLAGALTKHTPGSTMPALFSKAWDSRDVGPALRDLLINDLEPAARALCPSLVRIAERLDELGATAVSMTGSGATMFGVFPSERAARAAADRWRSEEQRDAEKSRCWVRVSRVLAGRRSDPGKGTSGP